MDSIRLHGMQTKIKWKIQACFTLKRYFCLLEVTSVKSYKTQLPVSYFMCYISWYHFCNFLEFYSALSGKDFDPKFSFFNRFTPSCQPHPLNGQNLLSMSNVFGKFFLKCFLKYFFFKNLLTKSCKAFFKDSNYRFSGLLFKTNFKNSYSDTSISNYL